MALYVATKVSIMKPQLDPARAFMTLKSPRSPFYTIVGVRAKGEVGAQSDTQDFRGSVQRSHRVTNSHLRVKTGLVGVLQDFWGAMAHLTNAVAI